MLKFFYSNNFNFFQFYIMSKKRKPGRKNYRKKKKYDHGKYKGLQGLAKHDVFIPSKDPIMKEAEKIMSRKFGVDIDVDFSALPISRNTHVLQKYKNLIVGGSTYPRKRGGDTFY